MNARDARVRGRSSVERRSHLHSTAAWLVTAEEVIRTLSLVPHPEEGGYYRETYRAPREYAPGATHPGVRSASTAIFYLLTPDTYSALHRLPGDEIFHFYAGDPVEMLMLHPAGSTEVVLLGRNIRSMRLQHVVPAGTWQGSRLVTGGGWALLGTTMAPGFAFQDYESGVRHALIDRYPDRADMIRALTSSE